MAYKHEDRSNGQVIRSLDWNAMGHEIERLEADKLNRVGDTIKGDLNTTGKFAAVDGRFTGTLSVTGKFTGTEGRFESSLSVGGGLRVSGDLIASKYVVQDSVDGGNTRGIWMWNASDTAWGIYMGTAGAGKSLAGGAAVAGNGFSSHAIRLRTHSTDGNGLIYENSNEQLNFSVRASDGYAYIRGGLTVDGNVGIGNSSPSEKLVIQSSTPKESVSLLFRTSDRSTGTTFYDAIRLKAGWYDTSSNAWGEQRLTIQGKTSAEGWSDLMTIKASGQVGIGVANPQNKLQLAGNLHMDGNSIFLRSGPGDQYDVIRWNSSTDKIDMGGYTGVSLGYTSNKPNDITPVLSISRAKIEVAGDIFLSGNNNITTRRGMLLFGTSDGSTATSGEVVGGIGFYGYGIQHGQFSFRVGSGFEMIDRSGDGPSLNYVRDKYTYADLKVRNLAQASSREWKNNLTNLSEHEAVTVLDGLIPVKFSYRDDPIQHLQPGFIAEEVPELVASPGRKHLNALTIVAVLTKVIKEQQQTITTLAERITRLEANNAI